MFNYMDLINAVNGEDFEERPVDIEEFIYSPDYLGMKVRLSHYQLQLIRASSQIYKLETLVALHGEEEGQKRFAHTNNEIIFQLGKGSGKDFSSTIAVSYIVYQLLCLKDPAVYYDKEPGDSIDILNIAINADQAQRVFFDNFVKRIQNSKWFEGKYDPKTKSIEFDKSVTVYSGHSQKEAFEGYNVMYVVLDEISGFALESNTGNVMANTSEAIYKTYSAAVTSRFPEFGKLVLLSFPRYKDDFIQTRYNEVVAEKETLVKTHTFRLNPDLPEGTEGNEFEIEWEEDHIISYVMPGVFALKRPSWDVNPTKPIDVYTREFFNNKQDALMRFACMPPLSIDGFFKDEDKVVAAFNGPNGVDNGTGVFDREFKPVPNMRYFLHVDLARKHDNCVVSMAHVDKWVRRDIGGRSTEPAPHIVVDAIRVWHPTKDKNVDFADVREYIVSLRRRGFNIVLTTFDRWESDDMIDYLRGVGMRSEKLSVSINHYTDLAMVIGEERLTGPRIPLIHKELMQLRIMPNGKLDHPRSGSKDLADATAGAVYNAIAHTPRGMNETIEIETLSTIRQTERQEEMEEKKKWTGFLGDEPVNKRPMPPELEGYFADLRTI